MVCRVCEMYVICVCCLPEDACSRRGGMEGPRMACEAGGGSDSGGNHLALVTNVLYIMRAVVTRFSRVLSFLCNSYCTTVYKTKVFCLTFFLLNV